MAQRSVHFQSEVWTIASAGGSTRAGFVPAFGGAGCSLVMPGPRGPRELLYRHDCFWEKRARALRGGWPFLFPVCGRVERGGKDNTYRLDGRDFFMPIHGFAWRMAWEKLETGAADRLIMQLHDDYNTRAQYPFAFRVTLKYRVEEGSLLCEQSYKNLSPRPMPWAAGFHPYFRVPPSGSGKDAVRVDFRPLCRLLYNERLTQVVGETDPIPLPRSIEDPEINESLSRLGEDKEVRLLFPDGYVVHMAAEGQDDPDMFPYVQLYTAPDKPFFCIEPWMSYPNAINDERAIRLLPPGNVARARLRLWVSWPD